MIKYETTTPVEGEYKKHVLSALDKVRDFHESYRNTLSEQEKILDERDFGYKFDIGCEVIIDPKLNIEKSNILYPFIGITGIVKECDSDLHAFGSGYAYIVTVQFNNAPEIRVQPGYFIKK